MVAGRRCGGFAAAAHGRSAPLPVARCNPRCDAFATRSPLHSSSSAACIRRTPQLQWASWCAVRDGRSVHFPWRLRCGCCAAAASPSVHFPPPPPPRSAAADSPRTPVAHTHACTHPPRVLRCRLTFVVCGRCSGGFGVAAQPEAGGCKGFANQPSRISGNNRILSARLQRNHERYGKCDS